MKKLFIAILIMLLASLTVDVNYTSASITSLNPIADGHHWSAEACVFSWFYGDCFCSYFSEIYDGIDVGYHYNPYGVGGCESNTEWYTAIIEFDVSNIDGLFVGGFIEAQLHLTVEVGDLPIDNCLLLKDMQDENENGIIEEADKDTLDSIGEICEALQPGDTITIDVTSAVEHDLFDPDQTDFSGFVLKRSTGWQDFIRFYDHTNVEYNPRLSVIDTQCEGNFDCDEDCDGTDASTFKLYFGRNPLFYPCDEINPCRGDFDCDEDVDGTDAALFKSDFGRSSFNNPCPSCEVGDWCVY